MYLGESIHYIIELSEHEQVTFFLKQRETGEKQMSYSKGDTVYVSWHKNSPVILAD
jgi:23S rRNA G2069 N7-methylase RlmK/C1962 C5-methylase RlmI